MNAVDFYKLPRAIQDRFVGSVMSGFPPAPLLATGSWPGYVARAPKGTGGFGYDPVFFDAKLGRTAAELDAAAKNRVSHRGEALRRLIELLKNR